MKQGDWETGGRPARQASSIQSMIPEESPVCRTRSSRGHEAQAFGRSEPRDLGCYDFERRSHVRPLVHPSIASPSARLWLALLALTCAGILVGSILFHAAATDANQAEPTLRTRNQLSPTK